MVSGCYNFNDMYGRTKVSQASHCPPSPSPPILTPPPCSLLCVPLGVRRYPAQQLQPCHDPVCHARVGGQGDPICRWARLRPSRGRVGEKDHTHTGQGRKTRTQGRNHSTGRAAGSRGTSRSPYPNVHISTCMTHNRAYGQKEAAEPITHWGVLCLAVLCCRRRLSGWTVCVA